MPKSLGALFLKPSSDTNIETPADVEPRELEAVSAEDETHPEDGSFEELIEEPPANELHTAQPEAPGVAHEGKVKPVTWTYGRYLRSRVVTACLWGMLAAGVAGCVIGVGSLVAPSSTAAPTIQHVASNDPAQDAARAFAVQYASAYLTATDKDHAALSAFIDTGSMTFPSTESTVEAISAGAVTKRADGIYTVTIAATIGTAQANPAAAGVGDTQAPPVTVSTLRYVTVPVAVSGSDIAAAAGFPAYVAAPTGSAVQAPNQTAQISASSAAGQAVTGFLTAYLSGSADVTRFVSPGVSITPVTPAVADTVTALQITATSDVPDKPADGEEATLQANVQLSQGTNRIASSTYTLALKARGGRWEVTDINNQTATNTTAATPSPTVTSTPSPTPSNGVTK